MRAWVNATNGAAKEKWTKDFSERSPMYRELQRAQCDLTACFEKVRTVCA